MRKLLCNKYIQIIFIFFLFVFILFYSNSPLFAEAISLEREIQGPSDLYFSGNDALYDDYIDLEASSAILMDADSGNILWEKNSGESVYPASITKIMTCIVAIENINDLGEIVSISENASGANHSAFVFSEQDNISLLDLLKAALISSHNNATIALAENIAGSTEDFVELMNEKAVELGAFNTNFENTNGLDSRFPGHKTTAYDIAIISRYAMDNELFREIVGTSRANITLNDEEIILTNTNQLLSHGYVKGIKTGYTENAGFCIATYSDLNDLRLIAVILNSSIDGREKDALKLIYWADNNIKTVKLVDSTVPFDLVEIGTDTKVYIELFASEDISERIHITNNHVEIRHTVLEEGSLPLEGTEKMGSVSVSINGNEIGKADLVSEVSVDEPQIYQDISEEDRRNTFIVLGAFLAFYFLIIIFIIFKNLLVKKYNINGGI